MTLVSNYASSIQLSRGASETTLEATLKPLYSASQLYGYYDNDCLEYLYWVPRRRRDSPFESSFDVVDCCDESNFSELYLALAWMVEPYVRLMAEFAVLQTKR